MANDESVLREVDQELSEERQWAMFRRYGPLIIASAAAVVFGVAGWQLWNTQRDAAAKEQSLELRNALELLEEDEAAGREDLAAIASENSSGVSVLAQFHRAASFARGGERLAAIQAYREIYGSSATPKRLQTLARLRAAYLSIADGRDAVFQDLDDLEQDTSKFGFYAREISGIAAIQEKDFETAISIFEGLMNEVDAPEPIALRAKELKAQAESGKAGVKISSEIEVDDILGAIEDGVGAADDHEGHDHESNDHNNPPDGADSPGAAVAPATTDGGVENPAGEESDVPAENTQPEDAQ